MSVSIKPATNNKTAAKSKESTKSPKDPKLTKPAPEVLTNGHTSPTPVNGNNNRAVGRDELNAHIGVMRQQLDSNVKFLEKAFGSIDYLQKDIKTLENRIVEEQSVQQKIEREKQEVIQKLDAKSLEKEKALDEIKRQEDRVAALQVEIKSINREALESRISDQFAEITKLGDLIKTQKRRLHSLEHLKSQIESFRIGQGVLNEPCGACMLPDGTIVVADTLKGLFTFSSNSEFIKRVESDTWRWPQGLAYNVEKQLLYVCLVHTVDDPKAHEASWKRAIGIFSVDLELLDLVKTPAETGMSSICKENLAVDKHGQIFLSLADEVGSGIWVRPPGPASADLRWVEVSRRAGAHYCYIQLLLGPIVGTPGERTPESTPESVVDLLVVESRTGYFHRYQIKDRKVIARDTVAAVAKPGAIAVDELGNVFVNDIQTGKIIMLDPSRFDPRREICLIDDAVYSITAANGYLGIAVRTGKQVVVFKYMDSSMSTPASSAARSPFSLKSF